MKRVFKNRVIIVVIMIIGIILLFENFIFSGANYQYKESYYNAVRDEIVHVDQLVTEIYGDMSDLIVKMSIDDETIAIIDQANESNDVVKAVVRQELYEKQLKLYNEMRAINFRQFHFHLLENESFLRFHRPEKFGDNLTDFRELVRLVQETGESTEGFEEGKIMNGYHFVYPIFSGRDLVGSVEASISFKTIDTLSRKISGYHSIFIIEKNLVCSKVFEDEQENYTTLDEFPDFYVEMLTENMESTTEELGIELEEMREINLMINDSINMGTDQLWEVNIHPLKGKTIFTVIIPVTNIKDEIVAYSIYYGSEPRYHQSCKIDFINMITLYFLNLLMVLALIVTIYYYVKSRDSNYHDKLTSLYNRKYFNKHIVKALQESNQSAVIMLDIDDFKAFNEKYGHDEGDKALIVISQIVKKNIRATDVPIRWGGEEFTIILIDITEEKAYEIADRIRNGIQKHRFEDHHITASFGITLYQKEENMIEFFKRVDENLTKAKIRGINQIYQDN
jgi:diguanylate cyclase (GGDEF)-like protein